MLELQKTKEEAQSNAEIPLSAHLKHTKSFANSLGTKRTLTIPPPTKIYQSLSHSGKDIIEY